MKSLFAALALIAAPAAAQTPPPASPSPAPNYGKPENWLCRPSRVDACAANQDATVIRPDGTRTIEKFVATTDPKFDCFYVYPTVSLDPHPNSAMVAGVGETNVALFQAARFARHCRVFAPLYRQITLPALQALLLGKQVPVDRAMAYNDVKAAWDEYLAYDNHGRGVVLIGHSQGSGILKELVAKAIEGTPEQKLVVAVYIPGTNLAVPEGKDVGGDFKSTPLCHNANDTGCVVSYATFRADAPPPANSRFGVVPGAGMVAACVNPAELMSGHARSLGAVAYLGTKGAMQSSAPQIAWTKDGAPVTTPFVKVPGLLTTACASTGKANYLALTLHPNPADKRTDTIAGDVVVGGMLLPDWGLHLIDINVVMGNLIELSDAQARAWAAKQASAGH
jgi:hypothetical protein